MKKSQRKETQTNEKKKVIIESELIFSCLVEVNVKEMKNANFFSFLFDLT